MSERFTSGYYLFLRLTLKQLSNKKYIKEENLKKLHPITHPVLFIGPKEGGRKCRLQSFADAYRYLGHAEDILHPGHPREPGLNLEIQSQPSISEAAVSCVESLSGYTVQKSTLFYTTLRPIIASDDLV
ncbi:hypothetical protein BDV35DRAFT_190900 [Aspergillus flavus]|uniref:Uncharacterized protein n=1 Tax=Aspergillus flavus TaxID=5059 RepID=A0A5N6H095_ASPFL|nr:hypothetical protein BDV35DRAFT_190900 [Aspergillus flavus]